MRQQEGKSVGASIGIGLWGQNGHQIHRILEQYPALNLVAYGAFEPDVAAQLAEAYPTAASCDTYEGLLKVPGLQMVSLCSRFRDEQTGHAIAALDAGIHVYAEKPCATSVADLDRLLAAVARSTACFHEMAGTVFEQPYWSVRQLVHDGKIGEVVQVLAQKSYPYFTGRPTSERMDGGLIAQNGVHAMRFIEHLTGLKATSIQAIQTALGEDRSGSDLQMACSLMGTLSNGGIFSAIANYLNPRGFGGWGNEMVRIFGTKGTIEVCDGGLRTRLIVGEEDHGTIDTSEPAPSWLQIVIDHILGTQEPPISLEVELHPTRMVLQAREKCS